MSRTRRATIAAGFGYAQFTLSLVAGLALVPLILDRLGARTWGLWLATGELLAYAGMVDLGVLGVLPWLLAEADGRRDRAVMRRFVANGLAVGVATACVYALLAIALWQWLPSVLRFTAVDRAAVAGPLALLVAATALTYPLRVFPAALIGIQDTFFHGRLRVLQTAAGVVIQVVLLVKGHGLYALAWAAVVPMLVGAVAAAVRLRQVAPDLMTGWTRPCVSEVTPLVVNGFGVWLGGVGWLLVSSSHALVITLLGTPESVVVFACTAKVSQMATQLVWMLPDSGLVGLAQLFGEVKAAPRVRHVVGLLQRVHLVLAGAAACVVIALNPTFVSRWVGDALFGGLTLNALLAAGIVVFSLVHGLMSAASVVGSRMQVGALTLLNGVVQVVAAVVLGRSFGLAGVAWGGLVAAGLTAIPIGAWLLTRSVGFTVRVLVTDQLGPWALRAAPPAAAAALVASVRLWLGPMLTTVGTALVLVAYLWNMRPLYAPLLALDPRSARWLSVIGLVPSVGADAAGEPAAAVASSRS